MDMDSMETNKQLGSVVAILGLMATIIGLCIGTLSLGYSYGKDINEGLIDEQKMRIDEAQKVETKLREEISLVRQELISNKISANAASVIGFGEDESSPASKNGAEKVILNAQNSAELFNGKIVISLTALSFEGDPLRHKVIATVGASGKLNEELDRVDVGYSIKYEGYEIRVVASDSFTATFMVKKLPDQQ